jgi:iron(III) transport system permease protein
MTGSVAANHPMPRFARALMTRNGSLAVVAWLLTFALLLAPAGWPVLLAVADANAWQRLVDEAPRICRLATTTAQLVVTTLLLSVPLGVIVAMALFRLQTPGRRVLRPLIFFAAFIPLVVYVAGWQAYVGPWGLVRWAAPSSDVSQRMHAAAFIHAFFAFPWVCGLVGIGLCTIHPSLEEQALLDAGPARVLWRVTAPLAALAIALAAIAAAVPVLTDPSVTDLYQIRSLAEEVYTELELNRNAHVETLITVPISLAAAAALYWLLTGCQCAEAAHVTGWTPLPVDRQTRWLARAGAGLSCLCMAPAVGLVYQSGLISGPESAAGWTVRHWSLLVALGYIVDELRISATAIVLDLIDAAAAGLVATTAATVLVWYWRASRSWVRFLGVGLICWLFVIPGPVLGLGIIDIFNRPDPVGILAVLYDCGFAMLFGRTVRVLAFATAVIAAGLVRLDNRTFDASESDGATTWQTLWHVAVPMLRPALLLAFVLTTALAMSEMPTTKILVPAGADPMVTTLFSLLHTGTSNQPAARCLVILFITGLMLLAGYRVWRWSTGLPGNLDQRHEIIAGPEARLLAH